MTENHDKSKHEILLPFEAFQGEDRAFGQPYAEKVKSS